MPKKEKKIPPPLSQQSRRISSNTALLVIDVQKTFCDPTPGSGYGDDRTDAIARQINRLSQAFRDAAIPVYAIYYTRDYEENTIEDIGFHHFKPKAKDILIAKNADSAFEGSEIKILLHRHGIKNLIICGFNLSACAGKTALHALKNNFNVCIMRDVTANDRRQKTPETISLRLLSASGVEITDSSSVLSRLPQQKDKPKKKTFSSGW